MTCLHLAVLWIPGALHKATYHNAIASLAMLQNNMFIRKYKHRMRAIGRVPPTAGIPP